MKKISTKQSAHNKGSLPPPSLGGFTIAELVVAVAILGIVFVGVLQSISFLLFYNRSYSQRMLAAGIATEILELFKTQSSNQVTYSSSSNVIYLKQTPAGVGDPNWQVPTSGTSWLAVPVEDVNSVSTTGTSIAPGRKLANAQWNVVITSATDWSTAIKSDPNFNVITSGSGWASLKQITVSVQWQVANTAIFYGSGTSGALHMSTIVSSYNPSL